MRSFADRLCESLPLLLDGPTGTELNRRGVDTSLPLWSAAAITEAPDVLRKIHADYVAAGAEVLTANTFRTHRRNLEAGGILEAGAALRYTRRAVQLAKEAAGDAAWVAGSQAPLEDCYSPELTPDDDALQREHCRMAENLAEAGVDLILVETQPTVREASAATAAARRTGLPVLVSFVCGADGNLLSGEPLEGALSAVLPLGPDGVMVNCGLAPDMVRCLEVLAAHGGGLPFGCYANIGRPDPQQGWRNTGAEDPGVYARHADTWLDAGARIIGGCCGTTPDHIRKLSFPSIAVAVVEHDGRFLVGQRAPGPPLAGLWEFPGGKVRPGESPSQAAQRECREETGLSVHVGPPHLSVMHNYDHGRLHITFFAATLDARYKHEAQASEYVDRVPPIDSLAGASCLYSSPTQPRPPFQWVTRKRLAELPFPAANKNLIEMLIEPPLAGE